MSRPQLRIIDDATRRFSSQFVAVKLAKSGGHLRNAPTTRHATDMAPRHGIPGADASYKSSELSWVVESGATVGEMTQTKLALIGRRSPAAL